MKTIHFDEMRQTGRILREMRQGLHESPEELARIAGLTRVQLGELEKGTWGGHGTRSVGKRPRNAISKPLLRWKSATQHLPLLPAVHAETRPQ